MRMGCISIFVKEKVKLVEENNFVIFCYIFELIITRFDIFPPQRNH